MKPAGKLLLIALGTAGVFYWLNAKEEYKRMHILTQQNVEQDYKYEIVIQADGKQSDVKVVVPYDDSYVFRGNTYARG